MGNKKEVCKSGKRRCRGKNEDEEVKDESYTVKHRC